MTAPTATRVADDYGWGVVAPLSDEVRADIAAGKRLDARIEATDEPPDPQGG